MTGQRARACALLDELKIRRTGAALDVAARAFAEAENAALDEARSLAIAAVRTDSCTPFLPERIEKLKTKVSTEET